MTAVRMFATVARITLRIILLPVQAVLTVLMMILAFAGGVFSWVFGIIGTICIIGGICGVLLPPADWRTFWAAIVIGSLIGVFPRIITACGNSILEGVRRLIKMI